ncbi:hypothetical protein FKM82_012384 [Ascaphus truei]
MYFSHFPYFIHFCIILWAVLVAARTFPPSYCKLPAKVFRLEITACKTVEHLQANHQLCWNKVWSTENPGAQLPESLTTEAGIANWVRLDGGTSAF